MSLTCAIRSAWHRAGANSCCEALWIACAACSWIVFLEYHFLCAEVWRVTSSASARAVPSTRPIEESVRRACRRHVPVQAGAEQRAGSSGRGRPPRRLLPLPGAPFTAVCSHLTTPLSPNFLRSSMLIPVCRLQCACDDFVCSWCVSGGAQLGQQRHDCQRITRGVQEARYKGMAGERTVVDKVLLTGNDDHFMLVKTLVRHVRCGLRPSLRYLLADWSYHTFRAATAGHARQHACAAPQCPEPDLQSAVRERREHM